VNPAFSNANRSHLLRMIPVQTSTRLYRFCSAGCALPSGHQAIPDPVAAGGLPFGGFTGRSGGIGAFFVETPVVGWMNGSSQQK
jgi:hypothetical protein